MSQTKIKNKPFKADAWSEDWLDLRLVSAMRLMLVASGVWVIYLDPAKPAHHVQFTYLVLALYTGYSTALYLMSLRRATLGPAVLLPWIDVAWFLVLVALTNGPTSIFFSFIYFAILVASFGWGYSTGLYLTLVSAILFTVISLVVASPEGFEPSRLMLRPIQLLILGYLISRWGGFRVNLRNRLQLLKDLTVLGNPRFGIDRTVTSILESLRSFYGAEACLLLIPSKNGKSYQLYRSRSEAYPIGSSSRDVAPEVASLFLSTPRQEVIQRRGRKKSLRFNIQTRQLSTIESSPPDTIATALETSNYLSVPLAVKGNANGRLYVIGASRHFDKSEMDFVLQLTDHLMPLVENIRLVDNLASEAAEEERRRIGHDIHDSVIQPYMGLQLGIAAVARKVQAGADVLSNLEELLDLTNQELLELRSYVRGLRDGEERRDELLPAINRFVSRFASVTGINVEVKTNGRIDVSDRLAAELFQIVAEGLSNIRRHALCNEARVEIGCDKGQVLLQIKNRRSIGDNLRSEEGNGRREPALFTPHSISERVALLGGQTEVLNDPNNYTVVSVCIPL